MCQDLQAKSCNASQLQPGMTYEKCEATCCEQNKCNGLADSTSSSVNALPAYNKVVSFATTVTSALYVLFFVYWLWAVNIIRVAENKVYQVLKGASDFKNAWL